MRISQWYKNIIIFLPLVFTFQFFEFDKFFLILSGFVILSIISSSMYIRNDIKDLDVDKLHPIKKTIINNDNNFIFTSKLIFFNIYNESIHFFKDKH